MKTSLVKMVLLGLCILFPKTGLAYSSKDEMVKVYSTSVVKRNHGNLRQVGVMELAEGKIELMDVEIRFPMEALKLHFPNLEETGHFVHFDFPVLEERTNVQVRIVQNGELIFENKVQFHPPKTWKIGSKLKLRGWIL